MYGTRDAAQNWEHAYTEFMINEGFVAGKSNPCIFYDEIKDIRVVVHGDDFTILAKEGRLDEFKAAMEDRFEIKLKARLKDTGDSVRILSRVVTVTDEGIEYEADQRHSEIIVRELGLDSKSKTVVTPGTKDSTGQTAPSQLSSYDITMFRAMVASANYLSQDRLDIQCSVKEMCRKMSDPNEEDMTKLKRLGRYLVGSPRVIIRYKWQNNVRRITVWTDTDYAGCMRTRKSTSGGVAMLGCHCIKTWSSTQDIIALSSGEAEYYGLVRGLVKPLESEACCTTWV